MKRNLMLTAAAWLVIGTPAPAGTNEYQAVLGGAPMTCLSGSGQPVKIRSNPGLQTLGRAYLTSDGKPIVELNFSAVNSFSPKVRQWWFAHECAHHQLSPMQNSEKRADCLAIRRVTHETGRLSPADVAAFRSELANLPASSAGHLPGPLRAEYILKCAGKGISRSA